MAWGSMIEYYDKTGETPGMRACDGSSFCISEEGQACGALLWEDVLQKLPNCCEGRDESWNVEKGGVENKIQKWSFGLSSS